MERRYNNCLAEAVYCLPQRLGIDYISMFGRVDPAQAIGRVREQNGCISFKAVQDGQSKPVCKKDYSLQKCGGGCASRCGLVSGNQAQKNLNDFREEVLRDRESPESTLGFGDCAGCNA